MQSYEVMLSTATTADSLKIPTSLLIVHSHESSRVSLDILCNKLDAVTGGSPSIVSFRDIARMDLNQYHCIFLDELVQPLLAGISDLDLEAIQNLCTAQAILWVVQGAQIDSSTPDSSLAIGLVRCIRSESSSVRIATLDLDGKETLSPSRTSEVIAQLYRVVFTAASHADVDHWEGEYVERKGSLYVPHVVQDTAMDKCIQRITQKPEPYLQTYFEDNRGITLKIGSPGCLDTLDYIDCVSDNAPLMPDDVEIHVKAAALNFRDMMVALDKLPSRDDVWTDCAGIITAVSSNVIDLVVRDRVCGIAYGAFSTLLRCPASGIVRIPATTTFENAASLPVIFTTAQRATVNVARFCKGESILIHAAAGGVGQAATTLSQSIGAEVYATVGNMRKKEFLMDRYGISEDHIFFSRDTSFEDGIMHKTGQQGMDVALNSLSGDALQATWRCVARFGRLVEIGKTDLLADSRLPMKPFIDNRTYSAVDLHALSYEKPTLMKSLLLKTIEGHLAGIVRPVSPITRFPYSKIEDAFRTMQDGEHIGKVVLVPQSENRVKVCCSSAPSLLSPEPRFIREGPTRMVCPHTVLFAAIRGVQIAVTDFHLRSCLSRPQCQACAQMQLISLLEDLAIWRLLSQDGWLIRERSSLS